jgi:hypothetical protein
MAFANRKVVGLGQEIAMALEDVQQGMAVERVAQKSLFRVADMQKFVVGKHQGLEQARNLGRGIGDGKEWLLWLYTGK